MDCKYFIKSNYHDWIEVNKEQYMKAENDEGFYSKFNDHPATQSFFGKTLQGKTIYNQPERLSPEENFDDYLKDPGKYLRRMEDNLINEILCDSPNTANK